MKPPIKRRSVICHFIKAEGAKTKLALVAAAGSMMISCGGLLDKIDDLEDVSIKESATLALPDGLTEIKY